MARNLLIVFFLFVFALPVYAGKPTAPVVQTLPARNITSNSAELVCSVTAGSSSTYAEFLWTDILPYSILNQVPFSASLTAVEYTYFWQGLSSNSTFSYMCTASNNVGSSAGGIVSFTTLPSPLSSCVLTLNPVTITPGASSLLSWTTTNAVSLNINQGIGSVSPVSSGSRSVSPVVTTTYTGTVVDAVGQQSSCNAVITVGGSPPQSVTVGAELLPSYNGFNFQCSNMLGTTPTRLFMRLTAGGVTKDYNYITVPPPGTFFEFWHYQTTSYDMHTEAVKPSLFVPLILDLNTLYSYQCCSENSFGSSCGDTGSIYTAPYALSFNYDFAPDWPRSVSYGAKSLWAMTINNIKDTEICAPTFKVEVQQKQKRPQAVFCSPGIS